MTRRNISKAARSAGIFGAAMWATIVAAQAQPVVLNCTLIGPKGGETAVLKIDGAAHVATWNGETGNIHVQKDNILFLGWHTFDVGSFDKETGNFSYSFHSKDGQRRFTQTRGCRKG